MLKKIEKIIEYGLYLLAFLLPIQTRLIIRAGELNGGYSEYSTISLYGVDLLIILLVFLFSVFKIKELKNLELIRNFNSTWWVLAGLEIVILISIFQAIDKPVAVYRYLLFLFGIGLFWILSRAIYDRIKLIYAFVGGAVLQAGLGVWQFFMQKAFALKWFGLSEHLPSDLGNSVLETVQGGRWLRAYGGMDHPNVLGGHLIVVLFFLIIFKLNHYKLFKNFKFKIFIRKASTRNLKTTFTRQASTSNEPISKFFNQFTFYFLLFILSLGIFFSFSRAAWLALVVGITFMLFVSFYKKSQKIALLSRDTQNRKEMLKIVAVLFVFSIILTGIFKDLVFTRFSVGARLEQKSYVERVESLKTAKVVLQDNCLFGVGMGNYTQYIHLNINSDLESWNYQPVHNVFLLVWAEIGIFGLFFYIGLILYSLFSILKSKNYLFASIVISLLTLFMFDHWLWSLHFGMIVFWFILGILYKKGDIVDKC